MKQNNSRLLFVAIIPVLFGFLGPVSGNAADKKSNAKAAAKRQAEFFERKIRPVLVEKCYSCHQEGADEIGGKLLVDTKQGLRVGGESGPAIVPGDPDGSLLIEAMRYEGMEMPPDEQLPQTVIRDFERWVKMGAHDPRNGQMPADWKEGDSDQQTAARDLWSLKPIRNPDVPNVANEAWPRHDIDRFVLAKLEQANIQPVEDADPLTLLRRVHFDLVGLPPSPELIHEFAANPSDARFEEIVDDLLASPQFGERWGRHWLDVARFAESAGNSRDVLMPVAWRYRDYVIDAFNGDIPFDRFLTEQIAGDLLPAETTEEKNRLQVATGFLAVGSKSLNGGNLEMDIIDEQIDAISKAFMSFTVSCARCHDHKFDPIPTADYYAMAGIFKSTETYYGGGTNRPKKIADKLKVYLPLGDQNFESKLEEINKSAKKATTLNRQKGMLNKRIKTLQKKVATQTNSQKTIAKKNGTPFQPNDKLAADIETLRTLRATLAEKDKELEALNSNDIDVEFAIGAAEDDNIQDCKIRIRGDQKRLGDVVPRGFLSVVKLENGPKVPDDQSGRLQLAEWLTHPEHPMTSRVAVNRIWMHLMGRGIVETVDNFGVNGTKPTHPDLLDYLARRYQQQGWSTKALIREIVLSRVYRLSSAFNEKAYTADAENTLYWRMSRRRLEAEELRDAILASAGTLNLERPHASIVTKIGEGEVGRGIDTSHLEKPFPHRSMYMPIIRGILPDFLRAFDFPEPSNPQGRRDATNVPAQSLFLMNNDFVLKQSEKMAERVMTSTSQVDERIQLAYEIAIGRKPTKAELARMNEFLSLMEQEFSKTMTDPKQQSLRTWATLCQALFASAEFRYLD